MAEIEEHMEPWKQEVHENAENMRELLEHEIGAKDEHGFRWCQGCHTTRVRLDMVRNPERLCRACRKAGDNV